MIRGFFGVPLSVGLTAAILFVVMMAGCKEDEGQVVGVCDNTPPLAGVIAPACGATGVPLNQKINATFNEAMDSSTVTTATFALAGPGGTPVSGTVAYVSATNIATFTPSGILAASTTYTYTIRGGANGVKDLAGNVLANNFGCSFTTGVAGDVTPPTVVSTDPANNATGVPLSKVTSKGPAQSAPGAALNKKTGTRVTAVGKIITATFSEAMDPVTITSSTFTVTGPGVTPVIGSVTYAGTSFTANFISVNNLAPNTTYTGTITTGAKDLAGNALASNYVWRFTTGAGPDVTPPTVVFTDPVNNAIGVALNKKIAATFSEAMNPSTITSTTFTLQRGTTSVLGTVTYTGITAIFTPANNLAANTAYTGTITTGAKDSAGNALASNYVWNFTTGAAPDVTPPTVISTDPANNATGVAINKKIAATFSEAMDPTTITSTKFTLQQGTTSVSGTVTYAGTTAIFTPTSNLAATTTYTATITTGAKDLAGNALASNYVWSFTTAAAADVIPPTVISADPANNATGVALNKIITAIFSEAMDPSTITTGTVSVTGLGGATVIGTVSYSAAGTTVTFTPASNLAPNTRYTGTITTGVKDLAGNALASNYIWNFTTGAAPDVTPPRVISTDPGDNSYDININKMIVAVFSEQMNGSTITTTTFTLRQGTTPVLGTVVGAGSSATFTPASNLAAGTTYTAMITTGAKDLAGNGLASNYVWTFSTGAGPDVTPPTVVSTDPANNATDVALNKIVTAIFSEVMNPLTITKTTFTLEQGTTPVSDTVTYAGTTATFTPASDFAYSTTYTATITTGAKDLAGNALASSYVWRFTTGAAPPPPGPALVNLTCATDFVVLAGSTITSTGLTSVTGDIGLSPGSALVGFPPAIVAGTVHINDITANNAKLCLTEAYNDAAGRSLNVIVVSDGELGGKTLAPGLYKSAPGSFGITNSDLTLDAQGNANAVWIFQMPSSTLTVGNGRQVILAGGAQAKNIFWQVGSSATIGTTAVMMGNILADQSITLQTGATLVGRVLTRIAAVSLDSNTIVKP
jgi:hypothetical protein